MSKINSKIEIAFLLPVYNCAVSIEKTLLSIFNQDFKDFKIYIINNGSTDNTDSIIKKYALSDKRIKIYTLEKPNLTEALCFGIENIKEEFIMRIDSGDSSDYDRASKTLNFMKENPNCAISYTEWFSQDKNKLNLNELPNLIKRKDLFFKNKISHGTICIRKSILKKCNFNYCGFGKKYFYNGPSQDLLLLSIAKFVFNLNISKIPNTKSEITFDIKDSISNIYKKEQRIVASKILIINNIKCLSSSDDLSIKVLSLVAVLLNFVRLIKYKEPLFNISRLIFFLITQNINDNYIYQKVLNLN